jgi:MFS family permease
LAHALGVAQIVSWGSLYYAFPLFVVPMETELGWGRTAMNGALTLGLLTAGLAAFPAGVWLDRRGGRGLMTAGSCLGAVCLLVWAGTDQLWLLYVLWIGLGIAQAGTLYEPGFAVVAAAFGPDYRRGITTLALWGGLASTVFLPLTQVLIDAFGWRGALVGLAGCNLALGAAVHWAVLAGVGPRPGTAAVAGPGQRAALGLAARSPVFWCLTVAIAAYALAFSTLTFHLVPLLAERGVAIASVVAVIAIVGPAQIAGRLLLAATRGRVGARGAGRLCVLLLPVAILMLLVPVAGFAWLVAFAVLYGVANGIMTIVRSTAIPDLLTREAYGTLNGAIAVPAMVMKALAPLAAAWLWAVAGGYDAVLWACLAAAAVCVAAFWLATLLPARPRSD